MPSYSYVPETGASVLTPSVAAFTVTTVPRAHSLCGPLTYTKNIEGTPVDGDPLSFDPTTRTFTADSSDPNIINTSGSYGVNA